MVGLGDSHIVQKQHTCKGLRKTVHIVWVRVNQTLPFSHARCTARRCHSNTNLFEVRQLKHHEHAFCLLMNHRMTSCLEWLGIPVRYRVQTFAWSENHELYNYLIQDVATVNAWTRLLSDPTSPLWTLTEIRLYHMQSGCRTAARNPLFLSS